MVAICHLLIFCFFQYPELKQRKTALPLNSKNKPHNVGPVIPVNSTVLYLISQAPSVGFVRFSLYTRDNPTNFEELFIPKVFSSRNYKADKQLIIITHGWGSSGSSESMKRLKDAYLKTKNVNVILVDWGKLANISYPLAALAISYIGEKISNSVLKLSKMYSFNGSTVHMIGHSLGAHILGYAGRYLSLRDLPVARITGLDPSRPLFEFPSILKGLISTDALFVDIIHTNIGILGVTEPQGHADFYPNGGRFQPGCAGFLRDSCDHSAAYRYFELSILGICVFTSRHCETYFWFMLNICGNKTQAMGEPCSPTARGSYFLETETEHCY